MSNVENGGRDPIPGTSKPTNIVEPEIQPPQYPSLVCMQCQERSWIYPVLPTAPHHPVTPVSEDAIYPTLHMAEVTTAYHRKSEPMGTQSDEKLVSMSVQNSRNTNSANIDKANVTSVVIEEMAVDETRNVPSERENRQIKRTKRYSAKIFLLVGAFLVLLVIASFVFYLFLQRYVNAKQEN